MALPLLVVNISPAEFLADYQGVYAAGTQYQPQQMVKVESNIWQCQKVSLGHEPKEGSEYWKLLGNIEAVVTTASVEEAQEEAEVKAEASAKTYTDGQFASHQAAFVNPATANAKQIAEALIASGLMAPE
jgi:hypothetical protein